MKKAVAILINSLNGGGAEMVVSRVSKPLSERYELYIFTLYVSEKDYDCAGHIINIGESGGYGKRVLNCIKNLNILIKEYHISCVMSFLQVPDLINIVFNHSCKRIINLRGFQSLHTTTSFSNQLKYFLCKLFYRFADGVIAVSKELRVDGIKRFNISENKCFAIENYFEEKDIGDDLEDFKVKDFLQTHKTIVSVGRLVWTKNYEELLYVTAAVKQKVPDIGLLILGEGEERLKLERLINELNINENVLLAGNKKNPMSYVKKCQMYVSFSFFEGFPNALLEAMMCEVSVLHTACKTGPIEMLTGEYTGNEQIEQPEFVQYGILVPDYFGMKDEKRKRENRKDIAEMICKVLDDKELRAEYGKKAKQRAKQYSKEKCVEKYVQVIEEITGQ